MTFYYLKNAISTPDTSPILLHTRPCPDNTGRMEVVGWSPSEKLQDSDMFHTPPSAERWNGAESGEPRYALVEPPPQPPLTPRLSTHAGPSLSPPPTPPAPHPESTTVYQRRLKDPKHVPRPRNAFIIYRCEFTKNYLANGGSERACETEKKSLSKRAGEAWKNEKPETKRYYGKLADEERACHRINHPDYRFRPRRQKSAGQTGGRRSPKRRVSSPCSKRSAGRSSSVSSVDCSQASQNDPLQIQTITVPTSSSTLSQPHLSRQPTPDFFHGYGSTTPSPCSPLSPVDDFLYMPQPTIAEGHSDSLLSYSTYDSKVSGSSRLYCGVVLTVVLVLRVSQRPSRTLPRRLLLVRENIHYARPNIAVQLPPSCCCCLFAGRMGR